MAEKKNQIPTNVVPMAAEKCTCEGCKAKPTRAGYCSEHFDWFKAGLITKEGKKALDFEKKHYHYMLKNKKSA